MDDFEKSLVGAFGGGVYAVGGNVRDEQIAAVHGTALRGKKDRDYLVVGLDQETVLTALQRMGRVNMVGASFVSFKVTLESGEACDVALPRLEISTGTGHKDFAISTGPEVTLMDDLGRRDFRVNALARRLADGMVFGLEGALENVRDRILDTTSAQSFADDPLRILRIAQFAARYPEFRISDATRLQAHANAHLLSTVAAERVREEFEKMFLMAPRPSVGFNFLHEIGGLRILIPELDAAFGVEQPKEWHAYDVGRHTMEALDAAARRTVGDARIPACYAATFHDVGKAPVFERDGDFKRHAFEGAEIFQGIGRRLRMPMELAETIRLVTQNHMYQADAGLSDSGVRRFLKRIDPEFLALQFGLRDDDMDGCGMPRDIQRKGEMAFRERVGEIMREMPALSRSDLAVDGRQVFEMFRDMHFRGERYVGGPEIGATLSTLLELVLDRPELNDAELLLEQARERVNQWDRELGYREFVPERGLLDPGEREF